MGSKIMMIKVMCGCKSEASKIAEKLLDEWLIACANVVGPVESIFRWKGKIETEKEYMLLMKTQEKHVKEITQTVAQLHSYDLPEVSALPITDGDPRYAEWVSEETL